MADWKRAVAIIRDQPRAGATIREAAAIAAVHVATLCWWQKRDPEFRRALERARSVWLSRARQARPKVAWHSRCPRCRHCHDLTYRSCQESSTPPAFFRKLPADVGWT